MYGGAYLAPRIVLCIVMMKPWPAGRVDGRAINAQRQRPECRSGRVPGWIRRNLLTAPLCLGLGLTLGCSRLHSAASESYVYVDAKQTFLRDRVAAVSNRTGTVSNGDRLEVLEHGRRFLRVKTNAGVTGWIDEKAVVSQSVYDAFDEMKRQFASQTPVASAVIRDEVYLHVKPGRDTDKLFRLNEGDKLKLLRRATLEKALPPGQAATPAAPVIRRAKKARDAAEPVVDPNAPVPPPMEDWWLVRLEDGRAGWLLSRMMDVDAPDSLTRYSEGQRFVGAYILRTINDPDAPMEDKNVPEWVTVLSSFKAGLPYDFDQVRVFIWNAKKHRYETGFREKNIAGFLPIEVKMASDPSGKTPQMSEPAPTFTYRVLPAEASLVVPDKVTGAVVAPNTISKTYRLEGNITRRLLPPNTTAPEEFHPYPVAEKKTRLRR